MEKEGVKLSFFLQEITEAQHLRFTLVCVSQWCRPLTKADYKALVPGPSGETTLRLFDVNNPSFWVIYDINRSRFCLHLCSVVLVLPVPPFSPHLFISHTLSFRHACTYMQWLHCLHCVFSRHASV